MKRATPRSVQIFFSRSFPLSLLLLLLSLAHVLHHFAPFFIIVRLCAPLPLALRYEDCHDTMAEWTVLNRASR